MFDLWKMDGEAPTGVMSLIPLGGISLCSQRWKLQET